MIRIGQYDAFDKWHFLCRHWEDKNSLPDLGVDKFDRPRLPHWVAMATSGGRVACLEYIRLKGDAPGALPPPIDEDSIASEIAELLGQIGRSGVEAQVRGLVEAIARDGFLGASSERLSPRLVARMKDVFRQGAIDFLRWTEEPGEIPTLEILRSQRAGFPINAIRHKRRVLCLFCARFYGRSDVVHVHDIGPDWVTLVDNDAQSMEDMKAIYPSDWHFIVSDYRDFLVDANKVPEIFDLIIADTWPWIAKEVVWDNLGSLIDLCSDTLVTNYFAEMLDELQVAADDLKELSNAVSKKTGVDVVFSAMVPRGTGVYWAVMHKQVAGDGQVMGRT